MITVAPPAPVAVPEPSPETPRERIARLHAQASEIIAKEKGITISPRGQVAIRMLSASYATELPEVSVRHLERMSDEGALEAILARTLGKMVKDGTVKLAPRAEGAG
jgi:hypothetical protein